LQRTIAVADDKVYDTKAWSLPTAAPVRCTPLVAGDYVYFGNAKGVFYAVQKKTGDVKWKYETGQAIHSSATGANGKIFFADNQQALYALNEKDGKLVWKYSFGKKLDYPWRFDYFYSSPVVYNDKIIIGGDDGYVHLVNQKDGKEVWKYKAINIVRTTIAVESNMAYFGDVNGAFYAVDMLTGKNNWLYSTMGDTLKSEDFGYDRKAILSSPVVHQNKIIFGARDGFVYCLDKQGNLLWKYDHDISWAISTVAIKDDKIITGTSDGQFVQALDINTGNELWRYKGSTLFWSSPLIVSNKIYIGGFDGQLYCIDLNTGKKISQFASNSTILSSAVYNNEMIYVGSDDGNLYALKGHADKRIADIDNLKRYVFYEPGIKVHYNDGSDLRVKNYLVAQRFKTIVSDTLTALLNSGIGKNTVLVFASDYFPRAIINNKEESLLRKYLDNGGKVILAGINPLSYRISERQKVAYGFNVQAADTVLGIKYGPNDTRSFDGIFPNFPTEKGKEFGLSDSWVSMLYIDPKQVDVVLGKNENGRVSAFMKKYKNGGQLIQVFLNPDMPVNMDAIIKLAEWEIK
jgi:outer membrane protein assembly factor BamB